MVLGEQFLKKEYLNIWGKSITEIYAKLGFSLVGS